MRLRRVIVGILKFVAGMTPGLCLVAAEQQWQWALFILSLGGFVGAVFALRLADPATVTVEILDLASLGLFSGLHSDTPPPPRDQNGLELVVGTPGMQPAPSIVYALDPAWRTANTVGIARMIHGRGDMLFNPILADALEEAGCDDEALLRACRERLDVSQLIGFLLADDVTGYGYSLNPTVGREE